MLLIYIFYRISIIYVSSRSCLKVFSLSLIAVIANTKQTQQIELKRRASANVNVSACASVSWACAKRSALLAVLRAADDRHIIALSVHFPNPHSTTSTAEQRFIPFFFLFLFRFSFVLFCLALFLLLLLLLMRGSACGALCVFVLVRYLLLTAPPPPPTLP